MNHGVHVARQCSRTRCLPRWTVWLPSWLPRGAGRAISKKDLVSGPIRGLCALQVSGLAFSAPIARHLVFQEMRVVASMCPVSGPPAECLEFRGRQYSRPHSVPGLHESVFITFSAGYKLGRLRSHVGQDVMGIDATCLGNCPADGGAVPRAMCHQVLVVGQFGFT